MGRGGNWVTSSLHHQQLEPILGLWVRLHYDVIKHYIIIVSLNIPVSFPRMQNLWVLNTKFRCLWVE